MLRLWIFLLDLLNETLLLFDPLRIEAEEIVLVEILHIYLSFEDSSNVLCNTY